MPADSDAAALLRAVLLAPEDEAPRLVYADFLEDRGQADRARLIRWMIRVPTYRFFWRQSRLASRPKHEHKEAIKAIRGFNPRLTVLCRDEWGPRRGVEQVTMRRGFGEPITLPAQVFLATGGELFAAHPFTSVIPSDPHPRPSWGPFGPAEASVSGDVPIWDQWPPVLFPDKAPETTVHYPSFRAAEADLAVRAAGYGRRMAGIAREPPPLSANIGNRAPCSDSR